MTIDKMFEIAARRKFRFNTEKGNLTIEDLFDLPLDSSDGSASLNTIAKALNKKLKETDSEDFVKINTRKDLTDTYKFELVKHIIFVRLKDIEAAEKAQMIKAKKAQILELMAEKENDELKSMSKDELMALLDSLSN